MKTKKTKTFYYVSEGEPPFDMWSNCTIAMRFQDDAARTLAKTNPDLLASMPFAKGGNGDWDRKRAGEILFETPEDAAMAYVNEILNMSTNREKPDKERDRIRRDLIDSLASSDTSSGSRHVFSIELPVAGPTPRLKKFDSPCCANCAYDYFSEDDGYEHHSCPFNSEACGDANTRCKWHMPLSGATANVPVKLPA